MSNIPDDFHYTSTHEWVKVDENGVATVGISDHAQEALGDIVFVELPEPGTEIEARAEAAVVESVKAASDIYSPVSGEITQVNEALIDNPQLVNTAPYDDGWIYRMTINDERDLDELLNAEAYAEHCSDE
ncbi:MAG: glycine cleavage system protein GcvH [Gammaproteobacteria bacterium]|nr:glycine cleavage system protein GcvH [Gammaproteobacteria bacterium]MXY89481.1 glycine cleavage system protein GcvH [Gammaproteobacteria bacterium]MYA36211.1 glycine cleavage system protein GcvH [Gammaproteobacteria bacterium]MYA66974.1 glycine cleavage system protein GcvH [Gammaproteobacteria bacterium]MYC60025.1 glycine cleavage system protein GcvH [Gammaproteobacteria bacterium]